MKMNYWTPISLPETHLPHLMRLLLPFHILYYCCKFVIRRDFGTWRDFCIRHSRRLILGSSGWGFENTCQWWQVTVCIFLDFIQWRPYLTYLTWLLYLTSSSSIHFALRDARSRTHANDDWCDLYFPWFYAVTTIPHIVDVISVTAILVVSFHFFSSEWAFGNPELVSHPELNSKPITVYQ